MPDYKDEVESKYHFSDGDEVTVKGVDLTYRTGPPSGYFYSLESENEEVKVLSSNRSVSHILHIANNEWSSIGLNGYLNKLDNSELISSGEGNFPPQPSFKSQEVEEELKALAERFLEE